MFRLRQLLSNFTQSQVVRSGVAGFVVRVLSVMVGLASSVVLARILGPESFGLYSFVLAILVTISVLVQLGLPTLVVRETSRALTAKDWPLMRGAWSWATKLVLRTSSIVTLSVMLLVFIVPEMEETRRLVLLIGLPHITLLGLAAVRGAALRGLKQVFWGIFPDQVVRPLFLMVLVLGFWKLGELVTPAIAMTMYVVSSTVALIAGLLALRCVAPDGIRETNISRSETAAWRRSIVPFSLIAGFNVISLNAGLVALGMMGTDEDVSMFRIAVSLSALAVFGLSIVNLFIQPYLAEAYAKKDFLSLQRRAAGGAVAAFAPTIPVISLAWFFGTWFINNLYGTEYIAALPPLLILLVGQSINAFFGPVANVLSMCGKERQSMKILSVSCGVNVALNLILIPSYGIIGAASASMVSVTLSNTLMWHAAKDIIGVDSSVFGVASLINKK